jgi:hypothetical protein
MRMKRTCRRNEYKGRSLKRAKRLFEVEVYRHGVPWERTENQINKLNIFE